MDLESGESIIFEGHPSWRSILGFYVKGLLVVVLLSAAVGAISKVSEDEVKKGWVGAALGAGLVILILAGWFKRIFTKYVITTNRLYIRRGIVSRREQQTQLSKVQNVNTSQSAFQRLLQVGTVDFDTAAGDDYDFKFAGVEDPQEVVTAVHRAQSGSPA
jgi:uncharacterized membrane protein YdbT with pleckstrin-like domain